MGRVLVDGVGGARAGGLRPAAGGRAPLDGGLPAMDNGLQPIDDGLRPIADGLQPVADGLRPLDFGLRPIDDGLRPLDFGLRPLGNGRHPQDFALRPGSWHGGRLSGGRSAPRGGLRGVPHRSPQSVSSPLAQKFTLMAFYDSIPPVFYDSGVRYDEAPTPANTRMTRIKRNWTRLNRGGRITFAKTVRDGLTGNPDVPTPNPTLVALTAAIDLAEGKQAAVAELETQLRAKRAEEAAAQDALALALDIEASTVESATGGDAMKIVTTGFLIADAPAPPQPVGQVTNFNVTAADIEGALDGQCDPLPYAKSYEIQTCSNPNDPTSWAYRTSVTASSFRLEGLPSGQRCWVRMRALGSLGPGPWSDPATKIVP